MTLQTIGGRPEPLQRTFRKSTQHVSQEYKKRFELEEEEQRRRKMYQARRAKPERKLTQQELLEEAKITERENLSTLEAYSRMEAEKKKVEKKKVVYSGPVIRFHSTSMPFVTEISNNTTIDHSRPPDSTDTHTQGSTNVSENSANSQKDTNKSTNKYTRNFLVFTDTQGFPESYFPTDKPKYPRKRFCPVTGLPAKYVDPLTGECSGLTCTYRCTCVYRFSPLIHSELNESTAGADALCSFCCMQAESQGKRKLRVGNDRP